MTQDSDPTNPFKPHLPSEPDGGYDASYFDPFSSSPGNLLPTGVEQAGFSIAELDPSQRATVPLPLKKLLPNPEQAYDLALPMMENGAIETTDNPDDWRAEELPVHISLSQAEVEEALGRALSLDADRPDAVTVADLSRAFPELTAAMTQSTAFQATCISLQESFRDSLPSKSRSWVRAATQAFEVDNGRSNFKIINTTATPLTGRRLQQLMNAARVMDDLTGGTSTEILQAITIVSKTHKGWETKRGRVVGRATKTGFVLSEAQLEQPGVSSAEDDNDFEITVFHEYFHVLDEAGVRVRGRRTGEDMGWEYPRDANGNPDRNKKARFIGFPRYSDNPDPYGMTNELEDAAVSAHILHEGGVNSDWLDTERRVAVEGLYRSLHTGNQAPAFLRCKELDITAMAQTGEPLIVRPQRFLWRPTLQYLIRPTERHERIMFGLIVKPDRPVWYR